MRFMQRRAGRPDFKFTPGGDDAARQSHLFVDLFGQPRTVQIIDIVKILPALAGRDGLV